VGDPLDDSEVTHNGFVESFNGRLRDERLNEHLLTNFKGDSI
jgi:Integrase core domain